MLTDSHADITLGCFSILFRFPHQVFLPTIFIGRFCRIPFFWFRLLAARFQNTCAVNGTVIVQSLFTLVLVMSSTASTQQRLLLSWAYLEQRATQDPEPQCVWERSFSVRSVSWHSRFSKAHTTPGYICSGAIVVLGDLMTFWKPKPGHFSIFNSLGRRVSFRIR